MSLLDGLLGQLAGNANIQQLAGRIGLSPEQVEQAIHALTAAHPQPGDTAEVASANTGLPQNKLQDIITHLGGENALGQLAGMMPGGGGGGGPGELGGLGGLGSGFMR